MDVSPESELLTSSSVPIFYDVAEKVWPLSI